jgi:hypothetical protein
MNRVAASCATPIRDLRDAPIECVAALLAAIARPCECEHGEPDPKVCDGPPDRWERRWAEAAR